MAFMGKFSRCPLCHKEFSTSGSLSKHKRRVHKVMPDPTKLSRVGRQVKCGEQGCTYIATRRDDMRDHLVIEHGLSLVEVQEEFESMADFREWVDLVSRANRTQFAARASDTQARATVHRYVCHRSGLSNLKTTARQRRVKSQGSCKMGGWCTAYLNARECLLTGTVRVNGCLTHYGHDMDVAHLRISAADRRAILAEIRSGVPFDRILENIRNDLPQDSREITRTHLITMGDIRNIAVAEGLLAWKLDVDDDRSVRKLAARFAGQSYSPILLYKSRGGPLDADAATVGTDALRGLADDDMALVIQTRYQRDLVSKEPVLVCVEPVTGYNSKYTLLALLATTIAGPVAPIGWCVCGAPNPAVVMAFFRVVHQNMGDLSPRFFMSEDTDFYYTAWLEAFSGEQQPHKVLSSWHLHRAWNEAVNTWVRGREKQAAVNRSLDLLMSQESPESFQKMLRRVVTMLKMDSDTSCFGDVFESTYAGRPEQWGNCFFRDLEINVEDFQTLFRRIANRLKVKRLDKIAHNLLLASESKQYENYLKVLRQTPAEAASSKKPKVAPSISESFNILDEVSVEVVTTDPVQIGEAVSVGTPSYEAITTEGLPVEVMPVEEVPIHVVPCDEMPLQTIHVEGVCVETMTDLILQSDSTSAPIVEEQLPMIKRSRRRTNLQTTQNIFRAHKDALSILPEQIVRMSASQWKVNEADNSYDVFEVLSCQNAQCEPRCRQCDTCSHRYRCSCNCGYMCRHIHACLMHADSVIDEPPVALVEEVVNTMTPEALAECTSFSFSTIEPIEEVGVHADQKKLEVLCTLHKLNETCVRAAELLATRERLPLSHQADYLLSTLRATNTVLDSFCRKGLTQVPKMLADHDYENTA